MVTNHVAWQSKYRLASGRFAKRKARNTEKAQSKKKEKTKQNKGDGVKKTSTVRSVTTNGMF